MSQAKFRRKLRVLVISMGGPRQESIRQLFDELKDSFEPPVFSPGVASRSIRNRFDFLTACYKAGLIPELEYAKVKEAHEAGVDQHTFFDCLKGVPVVHDDGSTRERRGSDFDKTTHYSVELWSKGKALNRGRAVFACMLAHLIAMKTFTAEDGGFDVLLEDNVRCPVTDETARRIHDTFCASEQQAFETGAPIMLRYYGWLGSNLNLEWMYQSQMKRNKFPRQSTPNECGVMPFPTTEDIDQDLVAHEGRLPYDSDFITDGGDSEQPFGHVKPGGSAPIWGAYAYWISRQGYEALIDILRHDVGAMLFKAKRARCYTVKPIDKIIPRQIMGEFGQSSVHLATHPTFFRAPMLTSKIHSQFDPEFCKGTEYQLGKALLRWEDLWLTSIERDIVSYSHENGGKWLTPAELQQVMSERQFAT